MKREWFARVLSVGAREMLSGTLASPSPGAPEARVGSPPKKASGSEALILRRSRIRGTWEVSWERQSLRRLRISENLSSKAGSMIEGIREDEGGHGEEAGRVGEVAAPAEEAGGGGDIGEVVGVDCGGGAVVAGLVGQGCGEGCGERGELGWVERNEGGAREGFAPGVGEGVEGIGGLVVAEGVVEGCGVRGIGMLRPGGRRDGG